MIAALLLAAAAAPAVEQDCSNLPQQPMNMCLYEVYERADAAMNAQWKITADALKAQDREIYRANDKQPGYFETLLAAQRGWLTYRDQQCLLESFEMRGGSGAAMMHNLCMDRLTRERTRQLLALAETDG